MKLKLWLMIVIGAAMITGTLNAQSDENVACIAAHAVGTMSNGSANNTFTAYDATTGAVLQSINTLQNGGASNNGGGIAAGSGIVAMANYGSSTVSILKFNSATCSYTLVQSFKVGTHPVSVAIGFKHVYVLSASTVESHSIGAGGNVQTAPDSSFSLVKHDGTAAQVVVRNDHALGITESSGTLEAATLVTATGKIASAPVAITGLPSEALGPLGLAVATGTTKNWYAAFSEDSNFHYTWAALLQGSKVITTATSQFERGTYGIAVDGGVVYLGNLYSYCISTFSAGTNTLTRLQYDAGEEVFGAPYDIAASKGIVAVLWYDGVFAWIGTYTPAGGGTLNTTNAWQLSDITSNGVAILY